MSLVALVTRTRVLQPEGFGFGLGAFGLMPFGGG